jgi:hypothetical protein
VTPPRFLDLRLRAYHNKVEIEYYSSSFHRLHHSVATLICWRQFECRSRFGGGVLSYFFLDHTQDVLIFYALLLCKYVNGETVPNLPNVPVPYKCLRLHKENTNVQEEWLLVLLLLNLIFSMQYISRSCMFISCAHKISKEPNETTKQLSIKREY